MASRHPLWEERLGDEKVESSINRGMLLDQGKETIGTTAVDAVPDMILEMPEDSYAPFLLAVGLSVLFVGMLVKLFTVIWIGVGLTALALIFWMWPRRQLLERELVHE